MVKKAPADAGNVRDVGSTPGLGRSPGGGYGNAFQYSCLENPMYRGAWQTIVQMVTKSQTRLKWLSTHFTLHLYIIEKAAFLIPHESTTASFILPFCRFLSLHGIEESGPWCGLGFGLMNVVGSLVAQRAKRLPAMRETQVQSQGSGRSPGEGNGNPLQYSCLENSMDGKAW